MLMRTVKHQPAALPWQQRPGKSLRRHAGSHLLTPEAVAQFDRYMHRINPQAPQIDADRIATLARWLQDLPEDQARNFLGDRLSRFELLRAMRDDSDWNASDDSRRRIDALLAYFDHGDGEQLIPSGIPLLGLLDDVLLLEMAWPALQIEAEDYRDFCGFRDDEQPRGSAAEQREAWVRARLEALALHRHHARVNASHYADSGRPSQPFRIG
jgi:hypothetical protein